MDNVHPHDLPRFIDPLLDYLAEHLPPPLYDAIFTASSYALTLLAGLYSLLSAIPSLKPWEWNAQTVLPPLIMFLTAYYTLVSLYRTTSFMVRMILRVLKWGLILGLLGASAGWLAGMDNNSNNENNTGGVLAAFRNGFQDREGGGSGARGGVRTPRPRPRAYESFTAHEQWRYIEEQARRDEAASDAQRFIQSIAGLAGRAVGGLGYDVLSNAKSFFDSVASSASDQATNGEGSTSTRQARKQPHRKVKTSSRRKTASR